MILLWLILLPMVGGLAAWALDKRPVACRVACLVALAFEVVLLAQLWSGIEIFGKFFELFAEKGVAAASPPPPVPVA